MTKGLSNLRSVVKLGAFALAVCAPISFANAQSYQVTTFDKDLVTIEGRTGTTAVMTSNAALVQTPIPFAFEFFGRSIASGMNVVISPHGWVGMDPAVAPTFTDGTPDNLQSTLGPEDLVAVGWGSVIFDQTNSALNSLVEGQAPNRRWTLEWTNCRPGDGTSTTTSRPDGLYQVQIVFFETTNVIEFHYDKANEWSPQDFGGGPGEYGIGIENNAGDLAYSPVSFGDEIPDAPDFNIRFTPPTSSTGIDLVPVGVINPSFTQSTGPAAGAMVTLQADVQNRGAVDSGAFDVTYYMSSDPIIDANDTILGTESFAALTAGSTSTQSGIMVAIPAATPSAPFFFGYIVDNGSTVTETNETNNVTDSLYVQVGGEPILDATSISSTATTATAGDSVTYTVVVTNNGTGLSLPFLVDVLGSNNNIASTGDSYFDTLQFPAIAASASFTLTATSRVAPSILAGAANDDLFLGHILNLREEQVYTTLRDTVNTTTNAIDVSAAAADIDIAATVARLPAGAPAAVAQGDNLMFEYTLENRGADDAANVASEIFVSTDRTLDAGDVSINSFNITAITAAGSDNQTLTISVPMTTPPGLYFLIFNSDSTGTIGERSERNNCKVSAEQILITTPGGGIDLAPSALSTTAVTAAAGESIIVTRTIGNIGGSASGPIRFGVYLSDDATVDTSDTLAGTFTVADIAAMGADGPQDITVTVPASLAAGSYTVGIIADDNNQVPELDESNNVFTAAAMLSVTQRTGDINGDTAVNVMDIQELINQILGTGNPMFAVAADVNGDGNVNVLDIQRTINIFLSAP